ncbi:hypothetical protein DSM104329_00804 [Capillimicrobium parvum]|uniref:Uncharacterized protein n=1 Tax=Capillimicrobium parvum TaxID=2884022 RepID=A0A9E7BYF0_9ACTN|nr:hypothetical protein DSM104329_00804 [Capillimicrobium parvum]
MKAHGHTGQTDDGVAMREGGLAGRAVIRPHGRAGA